MKRMLSVVSAPSLAIVFSLAVSGVRADVWQDCLALYSAHTATNTAAGGLATSTLVDIRHAADPSASTHGLPLTGTWKYAKNLVYARSESVCCQAAEQTIEDQVLYFPQPTYVNAGGTTIVTNQMLTVPISVNCFSNTVKGTALLRFRMDENQPNESLMYLLNMGYSWKQGGFAVRYVPKDNAINFVYGNASQNNFSGLATNKVNLSVKNVWTELAVIFEASEKTGRVRLGLGQKGGWRWGEVKGTWLKGTNLVPYYSPRIGGYLTANYASSDNNHTSSFRGSVHFAAFWNRVLSDDEVMRAFATPRPKVFRLGGEGYGHEMFAGADASTAEARLEEQHKVHGSLAAGESTTVSFEVSEGCAGKMQALRLVSAADSATGMLGVTLDGTEVEAVALEKGAENVVYVPGKLLAEGSHNLTLTRKDSGAGVLSLDLIELGGSWRHGKADMKMGEFAGDGGRNDYNMNWGYTCIAHSKIDTTYTWQRLELSDDIPASLAANSRYRLTICPCWMSKSEVSLQLTLNGTPYRTLTYKGLVPQTVDFPVGTLRAGENTFKLTSLDHGLSLDYVDLTLRGPTRVSCCWSNKGYPQ